MRNGAAKSQSSASRKQESEEKERSGVDLSVVEKTGSDLRQRLNDWRDILSREAKERPGRTAAIALGAGYVLGGGLFSALTARLVSTGVRLGFRLALVPFVTQSLVAVGENLMLRGGGAGGEDAEEGGRSANRNQKNNSDQKESHS